MFFHLFSVTRRILSFSSWSILSRLSRNFVNESKESFVTVNIANNTSHKMYVNMDKIHQYLELKIQWNGTIFARIIFISENANTMREEFQQLPYLRPTHQQSPYNVNREGGSDERGRGWYPTLKWVGMRRKCRRMLRRLLDALRRLASYSTWSMMFLASLRSTW